MKKGIILVLTLIGLLISNVGCADTPADFVNGPTPTVGTDTSQNAVGQDSPEQVSDGGEPVDMSALLSEGEGEIQAKQVNDEHFAFVETGYTLHEMGQMTTGRDARAKLDLTDGAIIRLGPNSIFTLASTIEEDGSWLTKVQLQFGKIWVILNGGTLEVDTISGTAAVRGSYLSVAVDAAGELAITCLEGDCALFNAAGRVDLFAGQSARVTQLTQLPVVSAMLQSELDEWFNNIPEAAGMLQAMLATAQANYALLEGDPDGDGLSGIKDLCPFRGDLGNGVDQYGCPILSPDGDTDNDGVLNLDDHCPYLGNLGGGVDGNGCPIALPDRDGDGYPDLRDMCPNQGDLGYGLSALGCPIPPLNEDSDGDGFLNSEDACPLLGDLGGGVDDVGCPEVVDYVDSDGDSVPDGMDDCPAEPGSIVNRGCPLEVSIDSDGDGVLDLLDACPNQPGPGENDGCPVEVVDSDGDGVPDDADQCPDNPGPELNDGCPLDSDGDNILDINDACPNEPGPRDNDGCPEVQTVPDTDGDGVTDDVDGCKYRPGPASNNGCPPDSDGDGLADDLDNCPSVYGPITNGGCPLPTQPPDSDGDGIPDDEDECPDKWGLAINDGCPIINQ